MKAGIDGAAAGPGELARRREQELPVEVPADEQDGEAEGEAEERDEAPVVGHLWFCRRSVSGAWMREEEEEEERKLTQKITRTSQLCHEFPT